MIAFAQTPFCAICTSDIVGKPRLAPIGKDDALVTICVSCDEEQDEQLAELATSTKTRRFTPHGMPTPRARAESAARMIYETGCTGGHAARVHNVSRCYANKALRKLLGQLSANPSMLAKCFASCTQTRRVVRVHERTNERDHGEPEHPERRAAAPAAEPARHRARHPRRRSRGDRAARHPRAAPRSAEARGRAPGRVARRDGEARGRSVRIRRRRGHLYRAREGRQDQGEREEEEAEHRRQRGRVTMARTKNPDLTEREKQIACMLALGRTPSEIAAELVISVKTVCTHRDHVREKLSVRNDVALARHALRVGWVTLEQEAA